MRPLIAISVLAILPMLANRTLADAPPRLEVAVADPSAPLTFIAYGDTRFTQRDGGANAVARRALGNHEFRTCEQNSTHCLLNWWREAAPSAVRSFRWYSVVVGPKVLVLLLDSDSSLKPGSEQRTWFEQQMSNAGSPVKFVLVVLHYPPVRDPIFPRAKDEREIARYLSKHAHSLHARVVVVSSHIHNYERFRRDDVTYLVSGGGGAGSFRRQSDGQTVA